MNALSVVVSAYNNQEQMLSCLKSAEFADEIIVVDNQSSDQTAQIAKNFGAKVYRHQNNPDNLNLSKNFGFSKANGDWILSLDTDERLSKRLQKEIAAILKHPDPSLNGYQIPRKNIIFGRWIKHGLWYPDYQIRLFRRHCGKFAAFHNHELLTIRGQTGTLKSHIIHHNYQAVSQYLQKIDRQYSNNEVQSLLKKNQQLFPHHALRLPLQDFLTNYFARKGYKDGLHGLVLAMLQAFYMFIVYAKYWESQGFPKRSLDPNLIESELKDFNRQFTHWLLQAKLQSASWPRKILFKIQSIFK